MCAAHEHSDIDAKNGVAMSCAFMIEASCRAGEIRTNDLNYVKWNISGVYMGLPYYVQPSLTTSRSCKLDVYSRHTAMGWLQEVRRPHIVSVSYLLTFSLSCRSLTWKFAPQILQQSKFSSDTGLTRCSSSCQLQSHDTLLHI